MSHQVSDPESMMDTEEEQKQPEKDDRAIDKDRHKEDRSIDNNKGRGAGSSKTKSSTTPMAKFYDEFSIDKADRQTLTNQYKIVDFRSLMARKDEIKRETLLRIQHKKTMRFLGALTGYLDFVRVRKRENIDGNQLLRKTTRKEILHFLAMHAARNTASNRAGGSGGGSVNSFGKTKTPSFNILNLIEQGFHPIQDDATDNTEEFGDPLEEPASDEDFRLYHDGLNQRRFEKGACYKYEKEKGVCFMIGIKTFSKKSEVHANCVRIMKLEETLLGHGSADDIDDIDGWPLPLCPSKHVQVRGKLDPIPFSDFGDLIPNVFVPKLIYEPQMIGSKQAFGYVFDYESVSDNCLGQRDFKRHPVKVVELFCASGGMHEGYESAGFTTIKAVDKCPIAIASFLKNNPDTPAEVNCVKSVLSNWMPQEDIHILHTSSPCCGFSRINRGGVNDEANNELSYTFYQGIEKYKPSYGVFENVEGMWSEQGMPYLRRILKELLKMEYQFRVMILRACDYGDAQKRPRLFIFAGKHNLPLPTRPPPTHGTKPGLLPFVKVGDVLKIFEHLPANMSYPNMNDYRESTADPLDPTTNEGSYVLLKADELAGATRSKGPPVFHPDGKRCVSVRETAALMSFPHSHEFLGTLSQKYVQVGNAVPCCLAKAVAGAFRQCLRMVYMDELDKIVGNGNNCSRGEEETTGQVEESDKIMDQDGREEKIGQAESSDEIHAGSQHSRDDDEKETQEQVETLDKITDQRSQGEESGQAEEESSDKITGKKRSRHDDNDEEDEEQAEFDKLVGKSRHRAIALAVDPNDHDDDGNDNNTPGTDLGEKILSDSVNEDEENKDVLPPVTLA